MRLQTLMFLSIAAFLWGCEAGNDERSKTPGKRSGEKAAGGFEDEESTTSTGKKGSKSGKNNNGSPDIDESQLASYLFTSREVAAIRALVDPYVAPSYPEEKIESSTSMANGRIFMENFANKLMKLGKMKPGRTFKVHIIADDFPNAYDDGWQNLGVHAGILKYSTPKDSLSTFCHEMAHSAKNAASKRESLMKDGNLEQKMADMSEKIEKYMSKQYDRNSETYVHNLAAYRTLSKSWSEFDEKFGAISKKLESEADVVGAMICASAGMSVENFIEGYREFGALVDKLKAGQQESATADQLQDGEKVPLPLKDVNGFTFQFLFSSDSHPSNAERLQQLERLEGLISSHYEEGQTLASLWISNIKKLGGSSLNLVDVHDDFEDMPVISTTSSAGKAIFIVKDRCRH